jgi:hypothetical protein
VTLLTCFRRYHTVQEFNKGIYDYIIATDESGACGERGSDDEAEADEPAEPEEEREYRLVLDNRRLSFGHSYIYPARIDNDRICC